MMNHSIEHAEPKNTTTLTFNSLSEGKFEAGDCVWIWPKTQGCVIDIGAKTGVVFCRWVGPDGRIMEGGFPPSMLWHGQVPASSNSIKADNG